MLFEPVAILDELANVRETDTRYRLRAQQRPSVVGREGERKFKILAVAQRVLQSGSTVLHAAGRGGNWDRLGTKDSPAAALLTEMMHVGGEAVADVDHGVQVR